MTNNKKEKEKNNIVDLIQVLQESINKNQEPNYYKHLLMFEQLRTKVNNAISIQELQLLALKIKSYIFDYNYLREPFIEQVELYEKLLKQENYKDVKKQFEETYVNSIALNVGTTSYLEHILDWYYDCVADKVDFKDFKSKYIGIIPLYKEINNGPADGQLLMNYYEILYSIDFYLLAKFQPLYHFDFSRSFFEKYENDEKENHKLFQLIFIKSFLIGVIHKISMHLSNNKIDEYYPKEFNLSNIISKLKTNGLFELAKELKHYDASETKDRNKFIEYCCSNNINLPYRKTHNYDENNLKADIEKIANIFNKKASSIGTIQTILNDVSLD